jgi:hypothetical protein
MTPRYVVGRPYRSDMPISSHLMSFELQEQMLKLEAGQEP